MSAQRMMSDEDEEACDERRRWTEKKAQGILATFMGARSKRRWCNDKQGKDTEERDLLAR